MEVIWRLGSATVRDVHGVLARDSELAYTTVMTVMSRLAEKRILGRKSAGKAFVYRATFSRERYEEDLARSRVRGLIAEFGEVAVAQFAEEVRTDPVRAKMLDELLKRRRRG